MKRLLLISFVSAFLFGCSSGTTVPVQAKIVKIGREYAPMTCVGQSTRYTVVKLPDNRTSILCGDYGDVGQFIAGYWTEGNEWDKSLNGFKLTR